MGVVHVYMPTMYNLEAHMGIPPSPPAMKVLYETFDWLGDLENACAVGVPTVWKCDLCFVLVNTVWYMESSLNYTPGQYNGTEDRSSVR